MLRAYQHCHQGAHGQDRQGDSRAHDIRHASRTAAIPRRLVHRPDDHELRPQGARVQRAIRRPRDPDCPTAAFGRHGPRRHHACLRRRVPRRLLSEGREQVQRHRRPGRRWLSGVVRKGHADEGPGSAGRQHNIPCRDQGRGQPAEDFGWARHCHQLGGRLPQSRRGCRLCRSVVGCHPVRWHVLQKGHSPPSVQVAQQRVHDVCAGRRRHSGRE